jgi:hypothetical protein
MLMVRHAWVLHRPLQLADGARYSHTDEELEYRSSAATGLANESGRSAGMLELKDVKLQT